eukprot:scaffold22332_cov61-Attheya_sp.AAC.2
MIWLLVEKPQTICYWYDAVVDLEFKDYIKQKKYSYEDGTVNLEENQLMLIAENKFDALVQSGSWNQPTREQEQIIALTATIQNMEKRFKSTSKSSGKKKDDKKKTTKPKTKSKDDAGFVWKLTRNSGETFRKVNGKTYYWCTKHNAFTLHKPEECRLEVGSPASGVDSLSISQALVGAIEKEMKKKRTTKTTNRIERSSTGFFSGLIGWLFVYINVTVHSLLNYCPFRKANKRKKSPQERQNVAQRPRKLKSRFFYRRTKKWGGQVCSTSPTDMPMALR